MAMLAGIDSLKSLGYTVDEPKFTAPELVVQAVSQDKVQIAQGGLNSVQLAVQKGQPVVAIASKAENEWGIYSKSAISTCSDLDGKKVGINSEGSSGTLYIHAWIEQNCPNAKPHYVIIAGSPSREKALAAGQLDATLLQLDYGQQLFHDAGKDKMRLLHEFDDLGITGTVYFANKSFVSSNPQAVEDFLAAVQAATVKINGTPGYLESLMDKYIGPDTSQLRKDTANIYINDKLFDNDLGLSKLEQQVQQTIDFFHKAEPKNYDSSFKPSQVLDLGPLQTVMKNAGD